MEEKGSLVPNTIRQATSKTIKASMKNSVKSEENVTNCLERHSIASE